jgi:hypothetical protein
VPFWPRSGFSKASIGSGLPGFARSHLSKIFDKTRQAEPVRLLLPK